ncbi:hypothetical protein Tco_0886205 [Tanacetum coccineum]
MSEQQTITYAPQWNNMTMDDVIFQTNNVVGNFNYPPNVPAYKPIMKFLLNCTLNKTFTNCPSVVYQNFLREFWSTVVAFDPFPSTNKPEKRPLREFLVLGGNYSSTEQVSSIQQLLAFNLITGIEVDIWEIIYSDLGPKASGALSKKRKKPKSKMPPTKTKVTPPKPTEGFEQSHLDSSGIVPDPQDLEREIQLASTRLPSTLDEGTRKLKPLPEGIATHPQDSGGNKQPLDRDTTSTTPNEGTAKTTPRPEESLGDKDSGGNIPPADMEPIHTLVADPSGTSAKYQVDET